MSKEVQWLKHQLDTVGGVTRAYLFGSFYRGMTDAKDVDLVVVFDCLDAVNNLFDLRRAFMMDFGLPLHVQKFHERQADLIEPFLRKAGTWEKIYG